MRGVIRTRVGYAGGKKAAPTYHNLGDHMESIQIDYDPAKISYEDLLKVFWESHRPDQPAFRRQYASAIFYHNEKQKKLALGSMEREAKRLKHKVYTEIAPLTKFWRAEDYHQKYQLRGHYEVMAELRSLFNDDLSFTHSTTAARLNGYLAGYGDRENLLAELPAMGLSEGLQKKLIQRLAPRLMAHPQGAACPVALRP